MEMKRIFSALIPFLLLAVVAAAQGWDNSALPISKLDQLQRHRGTALAIDYLQEEKITPISFFLRLLGICARVRFKEVFVYLELRV